MRPANSRPRRTMLGQAMPEYLYALPIMLLLILGAFQMGLVYQARHTLKYATFMGARAGALNNGAMTAIQEGVATGLAPLFTHGKTSKAMKQGRVDADALLGNDKLTEIRILNPTAGALSAHAGDSEGSDAIPNDNLMYRDNAAKGGLSVQDANLLKVRVRICLRMIVPIINKLIYSMVVDPPGTPPPAEKTPSGFIRSYADASAAIDATRPCAGQGDYYLPVEAESVVRMQSPFKNPGKWVGP
ncbi:TadE family protein [Chitinimonas sp.]|uniref:TadE family protein n=1 Tax=Chitinimonas sp. TaxID=1934313 RepID=UPI0035B02541